MILSVVILSISLSLDALGVGLSYGLRRIHIPLVSKLLICFFSIFYSAISLILGNSLSKILNPSVSKLIGVAILVVMGAWIVIQALLKKDKRLPSDDNISFSEKTMLKLVIKSLGITIQVVKNPDEGDIDKSGVIDTRESLFLGLALSVDAIGAGIGSSLAGFHSMTIPFAVGLFQLIFLYAGTYSGSKFALVEKINKKFLALLPGMLLICLALVRIY